MRAMLAIAVSNNSILRTRVYIQKNMLAKHYITVALGINLRGVLRRVVESEYRKCNIHNIYIEGHCSVIGRPSCFLNHAWVTILIKLE